MIRIHNSYYNASVARDSGSGTYVLAARKAKISFFLHKATVMPRQAGREEGKPEITLVEDNFMVRMYKKIFR
jgi:hypothetical protein